ncbi:putative adenosine kinase [Paratrimastix pyriformis]|uniref:Adenosine kinase n=1 Tax=Paratrimastix pyriformis TaxID=342808 RepID=A0ABQ8UTT9_9EUKA|nr:putative adenosine kinase [Paratrimastix pyriformis]
MQSRGCSSDHPVGAIERVCSPPTPIGSPPPTGFRPQSFWTQTTASRAQLEAFQGARPLFNPSRPKKYAILAISDALTDNIVEVTDEMLVELGLSKGNSIPLNAQTRERLDTFFRTHLEAVTSPGGSPTNVIYGASNLGLKCAYIGCVGNDDNGYAYINNLRDNDIDTYVSIKEGPSATCYTLVTPDGQRTFGIDFGVTKQLQKFEILYSLISDSHYLHFSAYEYRGDAPLSVATRNAATIARQRGTQLSFDLADTHVLRESRDLIMAFLKEKPKIDIIFANDQEARLFIELADQYEHELKAKRAAAAAGQTTTAADLSVLFPGVPSSPPTSAATATATSPSVCPPAVPMSIAVPHLSTGVPSGEQTEDVPLETATSTTTSSVHDPATVVLGDVDVPNYRKMTRYCRMAIIKLGEKGALAYTDDGQAVHVPAYAVDDVRDTNGAGDNFQAGVFYGLFRGLPLQTCLKIGNYVASKILRRIGAQSQVKICGIEWCVCVPLLWYAPPCPSGPFPRGWSPKAAVQGVAPLSGQTRID